jgi:hypothetical protein
MATNVLNSTASLVFSKTSVSGILVKVIGIKSRALGEMENS